MEGDELEMTRQWTLSSRDEEDVKEYQRRGQNKQEGGGSRPEPPTVRVTRPGNHNMCAGGRVTVGGEIPGRGRAWYIYQWNQGVTDVWPVQGGGGSLSVDLSFFFFLGSSNPHSLKIRKCGILVKFITWFQVRIANSLHTTISPMRMVLLPISSYVHGKLCMLRIHAMSLLQVHYWISFENTCIAI